MPTAAEISNTAQQQVNALQAVDATIEAKITAIKLAQPGVPLTPDQIKAIDVLQEQQASVLAVRQELDYVTMNALDDSGEIDKLTAALAAVMTDLNARTAAISAIGGAAANIGTIATTINGLIPQLKALVKG